MSLPISKGAYHDCIEVFDKAIEDPHGVRVRLPDYSSANYFRMRMHMARKLNREENEETYPDPGHPLHGASPYDKLAVRLIELEGINYVYVERHGISLELVEALSEVQPMLESEAVRQLEATPAPQMVYEPPKQIEFVRRRV